MVKTSSTSNSKTLTHSLIIGGVCLLSLFIGSELLTRAFLNPCTVPAKLYHRFNPAQISYGFDAQSPIFYDCAETTFFIAPDRNALLQSYPTEKGQDDVRIFTLGTSVALNPITQSYSVQLASMLNQQYPENSHTVINASVNGYGSERILITLHELFSQQPDLIILHPHGTNEFDDEVRRSYYQTELVGKWYNRLLMQSKFFLAIKRLNQSVTPHEFTNQTAWAKTEADHDEATKQRWQTGFNTNLEKICQALNQADLPAIMVLRTINPNETEDNSFADARTQLINDETIRHAEKCDNLYILNTPKLLAQRYPQPTQETIDGLFTDTMHWYPETHQQIARTISEMIEQHNLLERE